MRQPAMKVWDIGVFREFPIREGQRLQFRWEAFNLWNTPHFRAPNSQLELRTSARSHPRGSTTGRCSSR
jgi:hypothetical protein